MYDTHLFVTSAPMITYLANDHERSHRLQLGEVPVAMDARRVIAFELLLE